MSILVPLARLDGKANTLQGTVDAPSGSEPIGDVPELRLEDWLQKQFDHALNDAIFDSGHAPIELHSVATDLWDQLKSSIRFTHCEGSDLSF
jgi:hypothetical protein